MNRTRMSTMPAMRTWRTRSLASQASVEKLCEFTKNVFATNGICLLQLLPHVSTFLKQIMDLLRKRSNLRISLAGKLATATNVSKFHSVPAAGQFHCALILFFFLLFLLATFYWCYLKSFIDGRAENCNCNFNWKAESKWQHSSWLLIKD